MTRAAGAEVEFDSDGCRLAGTFIDTPDPVAAALIIGGSGPIDRDSNDRRIRLRVTAEIADALTDAGVSTLRYDKRGIGASGGDYRSTGMSQHLADARAALAWLATRASGLPLLVVGHSEGALHAIELAALQVAAGAVLLSPAARTGEQILTWQARMIIPTIPRWLHAVWRIACNDPIRTQRKQLDRIRMSDAAVMRIRGRRMPALWFREFATYDPTPALARISVPVLAITGECDRQVPPEDIDAIKDLVCGPYEGHVVADLSHVLRPDPDRLGPRGYRRAVRQPISPTIVQLITAWITAQWGRRSSLHGTDKPERKP
ncbi:alpha/beta fold hydrolase [Mycobacterium fragae]|uniref:Alpha/beta hydrolase n=1 Tax=Mycobacterium fragae TaxID=1260918 RepID=A0A1X1UPC1_9MYCO|nr:alpha/beta fold hydrolase [Mycobacterium fragae]MCV7400003.1 alpha/beta fold hydrolase [Mycobacterium fragae]ORV58672.1 alpha/beta hydrolase [Mycobacterium fragae]